MKFRSNKQELEVQFTCNGEGGGLSEMKVPGSFQPPSSSEVAELCNTSSSAYMEEAGKGETGGSHNVTPWEVESDEEGKIDYDRLMNEFGSQRITSEYLEKIASKTSIPLHPFLKRELFFSHRDLNFILDEYSPEHPNFYLYTGRGPSSQALHLGHMIPFQFTKV